MPTNFDLTLAQVNEFNFKTPRTVVRVSTHVFFRGNSFCTQKLVTKLKRKSTSGSTLKDLLDPDIAYVMDNLMTVEDGLYYLEVLNPMYSYYGEYDDDGYTLTPR